MATQDAIVRAGLELLRQKPYDDISVADLARQAGTSVGGFYARFRNKAAFLHLLDERVRQDAVATLEEYFRPGELGAAPVAQVVRRYVTALLRSLRTNRTSFLQIARHADPADSAEFAERARAFHERAHGPLRSSLLDRIGEMSHPAPGLAVNLAIFIASAAVEDAALRDGLRTYPVALDDEGLIREVTRAVVGYLGVTGDG